MLMRHGGAATAAAPSATPRSPAVAHWQRVCATVLALHAERGTEAEAAIEALSADAEVRL